MRRFCDWAFVLLFYSLNLFIITVYQLTGLKLAITLNGVPNWSVTLFFYTISYPLIFFLIYCILVVLYLIYEFIIFLPDVLRYSKPYVIRVGFHSLTCVLWVFVFCVNCLNFVKSYLNLPILFLGLYTLCVSLFCFIFLFLKFNLYFLIFQELLSFIILLPIIFFINKFTYTSIIRFIFYYSVLEGLSVLIFFISYLTNFNSFYFIFLIFKLGGFPFLYYKYIILGINANYLFLRILFFIYSLFSKILISILYSVTPIDFSLILTFFFIFLIFLLVFSFNSDIFNFIFNSIIFSNLMFCVMVPILDLIVIFYYILITNFIQFKVLIILKNKNISSLKFPYFLLTILNGNPIFIFNFLKILYMYSLYGFNFFIFFIFILCNSFFLVKSFYYFFFIFHKGINFNFFIIFFFSIFLILMFVLLFNFLYSTTFSIYFIGEAIDSFLGINSLDLLKLEEAEERYWLRREWIWAITTPFYTDWVGQPPILAVADFPYWYYWDKNLLKHGFDTPEESMPTERENVSLWELSYSEPPKKILESYKEVWYDLWVNGLIDTHVRFDENGDPLPSAFNRNRGKKTGLQRFFDNTLYYIAWVGNRIVVWLFGY